MDYQETDNSLDCELHDKTSHRLRVPKDRVRRLLNAADVARYCGVPTEEVLSWIDSGRLRASHLPYGRYRIRTGDFLAFLEKFKFAV